MSQKLDEHFKLGVQACLRGFIKDVNIQEKELPNSFRASERAYVHQTSKSFELLSKSRGKGANRAVTIYKKGSLNYLKNDSKINLTEKSRKSLLASVTQNPLTRQERQDLVPTTERDRLKVEICRSMGRLASGIPQVPIRSGVKAMTNSPEPILASLRSPQPVLLLKCGPDPRSRLLRLSQILLNDASERNQKIKVVATLRNGLSAKEFANFIASERHEKITSTVGYQDKLESQVAPMSILTFCLNEILLRTLMGNDSILSCLTHIVVDGVDQNDRFCDLLLLVLSEALTRYKMLKLIILSHAEAPNAFKTYFPQFVPLALNEPDVGLNGIIDPRSPDEVNFQILCLYAKVFARSGFPFADYLARMSNPPPFQTTRTNIQTLKIMEALNNLEDITELGNHLLDLPVDPRFGKMILYAVSLKCLDPVLTIVACLSYKKPLFIDGESVMRSKANLSEDSQSDHMTLLRAFQGWQDNGSGGDFCTGNNLSQEALESIFYGRSSILGHLRATGFVRAKGPGDIKDLNVNSENWAVIKAALTAGLYPNVAFQPSPDQPICAHKFGPVNIDTHDSVLVQNSAHHWYIFDERKENKISGVTVVSPITIFLFGGHNRLPSEYIQEATQANNMLEELSDSENDDPEDANNSAIRIDDWISFQSDSTLIQNLLLLRQKWSALFLRRLKTPGKPLTQDDEKLIRTLVSLLSDEEQSVGILQPSGIGQRPKHLASILS